AALTVTGVTGTLGSEVAPTGDNNVQWSIPTLNPGQSATITVTYSVGANVNTQLVNNTASVSSDEVTTPVQDSDDVQIVENAPLTIAKDFSNPGNDGAPTNDTPDETATAGSSVHTSFTVVTNTGISMADTVVITDLVPAALTVTGVTGTLGSEVAPTADNNVQGSLPTLNPGQSATITVTYS